MKILIIPKIKETYPDQLEYCVETKLIDFILKIFNKPDIEIYNKKMKLNNLNLIVFSGGNDSTSNSKENIKRKEIDNKLFSYALKKKIKMLGICHGAQFIAKKFKLKLSKVRNHVGSHDIKLYFKNKILIKKVNSYHNIAINKKRNKLINYFAISEDLKIEGFHIKSKKILGIQWHPERYENLKKIDNKLINKFYGTNNLSSW
jgi:N5-(cytidine 5'-diphosphoramidyl)-L-glutamine hydrolase